MGVAQGDYADAHQEEGGERADVHQLGDVPDRREAGDTRHQHAGGQDHAQGCLGAGMHPGEDRWQQAVARHGQEHP